MSASPLKTVQRKLSLRGESRPLVLETISSARGELSTLTGIPHDEDDIKALWEEQLLPFVWNIGLGHNLEPRIWPDALRHYATTLGSRPYQRTENQVLAELLPSNLVQLKNAFLTSTQVRLLLNCGADHVINLVEEKQLSLLHGTEYQRGRNGAALITIESLHKFFTTRRLS